MAGTAEPTSSRRSVGDGVVVVVGCADGLGDGVRFGTRALACLDGDGVGDGDAQ